MESEHFTEYKHPSNILRQAILDSGETLTAIERETGVNRKCLKRFLDGAEIGSGSVDALCDYLEYTLEGVAVDLESAEITAMLLAGMDIED